MFSLLSRCQLLLAANGVNLNLERLSASYLASRASVTLSLSCFKLRAIGIRCQLGSLRALSLTNLKEASDVLGHPWLCRICYIRSLARPMIHIIFHRLLSLEAFFKWLPQVSDPRQLQRMSPRSLRTRSRGRTVRVPSSCPSHIRNNARDTCSPCYRDVAQQPRLRGGTGDCTLCESGYHNWVQRGAVGATSINIDNAYPQSSQ